MSRPVETPSATRHNDRISTRLPVSFGVDDLDRHCHAENISESGLYINTNDVFNVGTRLIVRIEFPRNAICICGHVVWAIAAPEHLKDHMVYGMGVSLVSDSMWLECFRAWRSDLEHR